MTQVGFEGRKMRTKKYFEWVGMEDSGLIEI
jgi:hypothetical protein